MRHSIFLAALLIGLANPARAAEAGRPADYWKVSDERLNFELAKISVPRRAAGVEYHETMEFSHAGEGLDSAVKYRSADQEVFATVYVYYPSIAHTGIQAIATDQAILANSSASRARPLGTAVASAAGKPAAAVTGEYDHYLGNLFSKAAFVKAGRWMLKVRVSGPEARSGEVKAAMTALLDGLRFEGKTQPAPATLISADECASTDRPDAKSVPDDDALAAYGMMATFDAAGQPAANAPRGDRTPLLARIGRNWCRTTLTVGKDQVTMLEATGNARGDGLGGDSALLVLIDDGGGVIEVVRMAKEQRYVLLNHRIAEVDVLGSYDALPSVAQIARLFVEPARVRARVRLKPNGNTELDLPSPAKKAPRTARADLPPG
ncbi:MAG TPA: hypothetical protein VF548_11880 [Allosphingosinicella sp.]|jgi:hypothetical protein